MTESTIGGLVSLCLALACFYLAAAYDARRHGEVHLGASGSEAGCLLGLLMHLVFGDNAARVGFALGGLMFAAIGIAGVMQWL